MKLPSLGSSRAFSLSTAALLGLVLLVPASGCRQEPEKESSARAREKTPAREGAAMDSGPRRNREPRAEADAGLDTTGVTVPGADTLAASAAGFDSLVGLAAEGPALGPADAAVTIIEFSDFECPFCTRVHETMRRLMRNRPDVRLIYMQYPILSLHPGAMLPAEASVEAQRQGRFWELHDALFEHGPPLDRATILRLGQGAGLDVAALRKALDERTHRARVEREMALGERLGINGTPTFFINGYRVVGAQPYERFVTIYNLLLRASRREELAEAPARP
jgi:protein-disulfide isomerase